MNGECDPAAILRKIINANLYLTLGTVSGDGQPWVTPVFYACADYTEFYWISSPDADHSRNLAQRPRVSIVVFDSHALPNTGQAVYMSAVATQVADADLDRGLAVYPGPATRGVSPMTPQQLRPPALYRLYRATVTQHWIICPRGSGPCATHGLAVDHRTPVTI